MQITSFSALALLAETQIRQLAYKKISVLTVSKGSHLSAPYTIRNAMEKWAYKWKPWVIVILQISNLKTEQLTHQWVSEWVSRVLRLHHSISTSSVRTSCESRPITRPLAHSSSSHKSSSGGLATSGRSTKADMAPYNRARPSTHNLGLNTAWMRVQDRSKWRQLVETAIGYAHWRASYSMLINTI